MRALNYTPEVEAFRAMSGLRHVRLGTVLQSMGLAYGSVFTRLDCERSKGVALITQGDMFAAEPEGRAIRLDSMPKPERHRVRRWQVLIAGAGTLGENELYGRPIIADGRLVDRFVGPDAMVLTFEDEGGSLNLYTYAFLCSAIGLKAIRSTSFGTKILRIRRDVFAELPIPLTDEATVERVAVLIRRTVGQREQYAEKLAAARAVITKLPAMQAAHAMCAERTARCVEWSGDLRSLAAWNVASAGDALGYLRREWPTRLAEQTSDGGIFYGNIRKRFPSAPGNGFELISQRDLHLVRPFPVWIQSPTMDHATVFSPPRSIAMAGVGSKGEGDSLGRAVFIDDRLSRYALTQHVLRIVPKDGFAATLHAYLSTVVGRRLVLTTAAGTVVQQLRRDLVAELPVPELSVDQRRQLTLLHSAAFQALADATAAEDEAIRIIEEEVLPQWLA